MIEPVWIVGFAGHRPAADETGSLGRTSSDLRSCRKAITEVFEALRADAVCAGGRIELYTGLAAGADIIAAEVATELSIPVHVILPMAEEAFQKDFEGYPDEEWRRAHVLITNARTDTTLGSFRISQPANESPDCYHEANLHILRAADVLVAVWNRIESLELGSTSETVQEAKRLNTPVVTVDPSDDAKIRREQDMTNWAKADPVLDELNSYRASGAVLAKRCATERNGKGPAWAEFVRLDEFAKQVSYRFRTVFVASISLHFIAALLAAANAAYGPAIYDFAHHSNGYRSAFFLALPKILTFFELLLVLAAWGIIFYTNRVKTHHSWRRARPAAELAHGLIASAGHLDPLYPLIRHHDTAWHRFALAMSIYAYRNRRVLSVAEQREMYLSDRVEKQIGYFKKELSRAKRKYRVLHQFQIMASSLAAVFIAIAFSLKLMGDHDHIQNNALEATFALFIPVLLPLVAGAATSFIVGTDAARRTRRYSSMIRRLHQFEKAIPGIQTSGALSCMVEDVEEILLDEILEWLVASASSSH